MPMPSHTAHPIVLAGAPAVRALRTSLSYSRRPAVVQISGTPLADDERRWWEDRLSRYYPACGCGFGAALMSLTALVSTLAALRQWWMSAVFPQTAVALAVGATAIAAIGGKIIGLLLGHVRMSHALRSLELRLQRL
jgi:energy-converting hydrogenase Eha subunit A